MGEEMDAAIVGAAIAALVAVVLFVIERSVARHAAFVERRRIAFDEVIVSYAAYVSASLMAGDKPSPEFAAPLVTSRGRMALALRKKDRALSWWLTGMEERLSDAAGALPASEAVTRIDQVNTNVTNTLLDIHLGVLNNRDMIVPASVCLFESTGVTVPPEHFVAATDVERPRPDPRHHGFRALAFEVWNWLTRRFRRSGTNSVLTQE